MVKLEQAEPLLSFKVVCSWIRNSGSVTCLQDGQQKDTSYQSQGHHSILETYVAGPSYKFPDQEQIILAYTVMCCLLLPRNKEDTKIQLNSSWKAQCFVNNKHSNNTG